VRDELREQVKQLYVVDQKPIRDIASALGYSYGTIYRLLGEAEVVLRNRNGKQR